MCTSSNAIYTHLFSHRIADITSTNSSQYNIINGSCNVLSTCLFNIRMFQYLTDNSSIFQATNITCWRLHYTEWLQYICSYSNIILFLLSSPCPCPDIIKSIHECCSIKYIIWYCMYMLFIIKSICCSIKYIIWYFYCMYMLYIISQYVAPLNILFDIYTVCICWIYLIFPGGNKQQSLIVQSYLFIDFHQKLWFLIMHINNNYNSTTVNMARK